MSPVIEDEDLRMCACVRTCVRTKWRTGINGPRYWSKETKQTGLFWPCASVHKSNWRDGVAAAVVGNDDDVVVVAIEWKQGEEIKIERKWQITKKNWANTQFWIGMFLGLGKTFSRFSLVYEWAELASWGFFLSCWRSHFNIFILPVLVRTTACMESCQETGMLPPAQLLELSACQ